MQEEDKCKIVSAKEEVFVRRRRCKKRPNARFSPLKEEVFVRRHRCKKRTSARLSPLRKRFLCGGV